MEMNRLIGRLALDELRQEVTQELQKVQVAELAWAESQVILLEEAQERAPQTPVTTGKAVKGNGKAKPSDQNARDLARADGLALALKATRALKDRLGAQK